MKNTNRRPRVKFVGLRTYVRADGSEIEMIVWQIECAECGEPFECMTPQEFERFYPNRRCEKHHRPGVRAR